MMRLGRWVVTVALLAATGSAAGGALGWLLSDVSYDYVVPAEAYASLGLRMGLFGGALLAAVQVVGRRPMPPFSRFAGVLLRSVVVAAGVFVAAGALGLVVWHAGLLGDSDWKLANPRRHALFLGLDAGARLGSLLGIAVAATWLWRSRVGRSDVPAAGNEPGGIDGRV